MAIFKQGQLNQVLAVMVDKTDFASVESGVTSGFTCTLYTYKQNSSTATSATTLSRAPSVVRSGIVRITMKAADTSGVDCALLKIAHASCADQYIPINFQVQDISDQISNVDSAVSSQYSDLLSTMGSQFAVASNYFSDASSIRSNIYSMLSDFYSTANSQFAVVSNYLSNASNYLSNISAVLSDVRSNVSDLQSDFQSRVPKAVATASVLSDFYSDFGSRVPKLVATNSQLSDLASDIKSAIAARPNLSDAVSDIYAMLSDFYSDFQSRVTGTLATAAVLSDFYSDFQSRVPKAVATASRLLLLESVASDAHSAAAQANSRVLVNTSRISDIESALDSQFVWTSAAISDMHSDLYSKMGAVTVTLTASDISDIASATAAAVTVITASDISDIASAVWAYGTRKVTSLADVSLCASDLSDLRSAITAGGAAITDSNISDIASAVWANAIGTRVDSRVTKVLSDTSDIYSLLGAGVPIAASDMSDIRSVVLSLSDAISDIKAKTDNLTFTVAGQVDANIQYVNDVQVTGTGASGTEWGPA